MILIRIYEYGYELGYELEHGWNEDVIQDTSYVDRR